MKQFENLVDALSDLKERGYTLDFNLLENSIACASHQLSLAAEEFEIDETYRFEGMNDPDDSAVLYAISSRFGHKGVLVNAYGVYADGASSEIIAKLSNHH